MHINPIRRNNVRSGCTNHEVSTHIMMQSTEKDVRSQNFKGETEKRSNKGKPSLNSFTDDPVRFCSSWRGEGPRYSNESGEEGKGLGERERREGGCAERQWRKK